jgi:hypothetical protein
MDCGSLVHRSPAPHLFPCAAGGLHSDRSPERTVRFIPSCSRSSSEFLRCHSLPFPFGTGFTARVSSLFATSPGASTRLADIPSQRYVPSAGVLNLSTAFSAHRLRGLVSSRNRVQGHSARSGAHLLCAAAASSSERAAPLPLSTGPLSRTGSGVHDPAPSASRLLSAPSSYRGELVVSLPSGHSPLRVSAPPGPILSAAVPAYPGASAHEVI